MTSEVAASERARTERAPSEGAPSRARTAAGARVAGYRFEPHHCFACGELNEHGLRLQLHADENGCWTELALPARFQGWESVAHGGIACTILDEVMAWSVIGRGTWGVTARLNAAFRRPIPTERDIRAEGWVTGDRRRAIHTAGRIIDRASGEVLATAEGVFMAVPPDQLAALKARYLLRRDDEDPRPPAAGGPPIAEQPG